MPAKRTADSISQDGLSGLRIGLTSGYDHFLQLKTFLEALGASTEFIIDRENVPRSDDELLKIVGSWNQEYDIVIIPLTLPYYGSLRIAEVIHLTNAKVRIVLLSQSKQLSKKLAVPLFDEYLTQDDLGIWLTSKAETLRTNKGDVSPDESKYPPKAIRALANLRNPMPRISNQAKIDSIISNLLRTQHCFRYNRYTNHPELAIKVTLKDYKNAVFIEDLAQRFPQGYTNRQELRQAREELAVPQSRLAIQKEEKGIFYLLIASALIVSILAIIGGVAMVFFGSTGGSTINILGQTVKTENIGVAAIFIGVVTLLLLGRRLIKMIEKIKSLP